MSKYSSVPRMAQRNRGRRTGPPAEIAARSVRGKHVPAGTLLDCESFLANRLWDTPR